MGVPTSEVGYTIATTRRETKKVHKNMWWHWGRKKNIKIYIKTAPTSFGVTVTPSSGSALICVY